MKFALPMTREILRCWQLTKNLDLFRLVNLSGLLNDRYKQYHLFMQLDFELIAYKAAKASGAKRVILFGSHARGEATANSDVDLLLVFKDGTNLMQAGLAAYQALFPPSCGFDILPMSETDFNNGETLIARVAAKEGKVLYA